MRENNNGAKGFYIIFAVCILCMLIGTFSKPEYRTELDNLYIGD